MLSSISWAAFIRVVLSITLLYYTALVLICYRKRLIVLLRRIINKAGLLLLCLISSGLLHAQDGKQGLAKANEMIRDWYGTAVELMYGIGALFGLIGAVSVYQAFNEGHHDHAKSRAAAWLGACLFLIIAATVIKSFFGL